MSSQNKETNFVLRLQNEENDELDLRNTLNHWDISRMFEDKQINAIVSSNIKSTNQPTSIPSPFARIALVKTAFSEVAANREKALASYQKIVSDSLDVAEIFFTFEKWKNIIEILKWDKEEDLNKLESGHFHLYKTLKTFLENDAQAYNFDKMKCIYILKHKKTGKMIGATSPSTLFFSSSNSFDDVDIPLSNTHNAFKDILPLHKRSWDFQKYLYAWIKVNNENINIDGRAVPPFFEFGNYLIYQEEGNRKEDIDAIRQNASEVLKTSYKELRAPDVEVLGRPLYQSNDVILSPDYLNVNDLLEETIIKLSARIINSSFLDGKVNEDAKYGYLLPLKDEFFQNFDIQNVRDYVKINEEGNVVEVKLKISKDKNFIKTYTSDFIKELKDFDCLLYPNVKFQEKKNAYYRFGVFSDYNNKDHYSVEFFEGKNKIHVDNIDEITRNTIDPENAICKTYSLNQISFDRIKIIVGDKKGILIPTLPSKGNSEQFVFSVDFGTTNTHVEYHINSENNYKPFEIEESDEQIQFLLGRDDKFKLISDIDFIPSKLGLKEIFKFPIRTALSLARNRGKAKKIYPFSQANIIIPYEKRGVPKYNQSLTQLKWESDESHMSYFIDSLCFLLRNKVVLNGGELGMTKIIWFYPLSMAGSRSRTISNVWKIAYAKYFLGVDVSDVDMFDENIKDIMSENLSQLPESIAPYLFYKDEPKYKDTISNLVSIDIGGGTTDVVFVKDKKVEYVTSFRFAANSIFGLGEHITPVVSKYQSEIEKIIEDNDENFKLINLYNSIKNAKYGDLASFFFSLSQNEMMKKIEFNFNSKLKKDENQKLVFILFYTAIIYHTAHIIKAKRLPLPRHITFSGNGSKIVSIIADNEILEELSKLIFEKTLEDTYGESGLSIIHNTVNPKEVTCMGGIKATHRNYNQTPFEPVVLMGIDKETCVTEKDTYSTVNIEEYARKSKEQVKAFVDFVLDDLLKQKYTKGIVKESFIKALGLNPKTIFIAKNVCARDNDLETFAANGIREKKEKIDIETTQIEESFFFYPIVGLLSALSSEINQMD